MKNSDSQTPQEKNIEKKEKLFQNLKNNSLSEIEKKNKDSLGVSRRNLLKIISLIGGGGLINLALGSSTLARVTSKSQVLSAPMPPQSDYKEILTRARERLYPACRVCPVCDVLTQFL